MVAGVAELRERGANCSRRFQPPEHRAQKNSKNLEVSGILDWELATTGCSLLDPARFLCYERPDSKWWETAFLEGLRAFSTMLPDNCADLFRTLNTLSAAGSLAKHSTEERFIPELTELVHAGLRGKRIG